MSDYLTEQEQIELLKRWIKQYAPMVLLGMLIAFISLYGFRYWQNRQNQARIQASVLYDKLLTRRAQHHSEEVQSLANEMIQSHGNTVYSPMAQLFLAREFALHAQYPQAENALRAALRSNLPPSLKSVVSLRLARVLIEDNQPKESLAVLDKLSDPNFESMTNEIRGDAYLKMGDRKQASLAYARALKSLPDSDDVKPLLQMKFNQVAEQTNP